MTTFEHSILLIRLLQGQDGLDPSLTRFNYPYGLALERDAAGVKLYVADSANHQALWL